MTHTNCTPKRLLTLAATALLAGTAPSAPSGQDRPNVVLIVTDDQGYGDFGFTGNPVLETPQLDRLATESARLSTFYVSPVCSATRASLMTGRYHQRTGVIQNGRPMRAEEVTIAELLRAAGYRTGIFGKWHLGDHYPNRAMDQGFEESLVGRGGILGNLTPWPTTVKYTNPYLEHDGRVVQRKGFATDVYFGAAMDWIRSSHEEGERFFAYIATNAPHRPYDDVPAGPKRKYASMDLTPALDSEARKKPGWEDEMASAFALITKIDDNVGLLLDFLDELGLAEDTLVLFLSDNGPSELRYKAGFKGRKASVREGGIRSPFLARWPGHLEPGVASDRVGAHVDVLPTILDACGATSGDVSIDGRSLLPLLRREETEWPERTLYFQAHLSNDLEPFLNFAARSERWKLMHATGYQKEMPTGRPKLALYDIRADPLEGANVAADHPEIVAEMRTAYERWLAGVRADAGALEEPSTLVGTDEEDPVLLTHTSWSSAKAHPRSRSAWDVEVARAGRFDVRLVFPSAPRARTAMLEVSEILEKRVGPKAKSCWFRGVELPRGGMRMRATLMDERSNMGAVWQMEVRRSDRPRSEFLPAVDRDRPNVVLIVTDDQGYGDFGFTGNPVVRTPHLDRMAERGVLMTRFYVSPVCAPTRASVMTGRHHLRTGVAQNGYPMKPEELTIAEALRNAGYATGIFGKWHLGDHFPHRPMDQGFDESLVSRAGVIGSLQPTPAFGKYDDPVLDHNGTITAYEGFATDVYFDAACDWIRDVHGERRFFAYIPTNAPHKPYHDAPEDLRGEYAAQDLRAVLPNAPDPLPEDLVDVTARAFSLITKVDQNVGKLFAVLEELELLEETLVLFLTDNGPTERRFNAGLRGFKATTREGGIRAPLLAHWPGRLPAGTRSERLGAHLDLFPTILEACGVATPDVALDGISLLPTLAGEAESWPERTLFFRTSVESPGFAVRSDRWKLLDARTARTAGKESLLELFDMVADPRETTDVSSRHPEVVSGLLEEHEAWLRSVDKQARQAGPIVARIGTGEEEPLLLTHHRWPTVVEDPAAYSYWDVEVTRTGVYEIRYRFPRTREASTARQYMFGATELRVRKGETSCVFRRVRLRRGTWKLNAILQTDSGRALPVWQVEIRSR